MSDLIGLAKKLDLLSLKAFIRLSNTRTWFFATPKSRTWRLYVNSVTYREYERNYEGADINQMLSEALTEIEEYEELKSGEQTQEAKKSHP